MKSSDGQHLAGSRTQRFGIPRSLCEQEQNVGSVLAVQRLKQGRQRLPDQTIRAMEDRVRISHEVGGCTKRGCRLGARLEH
jgi:hypothetical protein